MDPGGNADVRAIESFVFPRHRIHRQIFVGVDVDHPSPILLTKCLCACRQKRHLPKTMPIDFSNDMLHNCSIIHVPNPSFLVFLYLGKARHQMMLVGVEEEVWHEGMIIPFFDCHSKISPLIQQFGWLRLALIIRGNHQMTKADHVVMVGNPFVQYVVIVFHKRARRKDVSVCTIMILLLAFLYKRWKVNALLLASSLLIVISSMDSQGRFPLLNSIQPAQMIKKQLVCVWKSASSSFNGHLKSAHPWLNPFAEWLIRGALDIQWLLVFLIGCLFRLCPVCYLEVPLVSNKAIDDERELVLL
mmetsp:Transcript_9150/g.26138  ORF Transcript_9150/g.26138 Transcript_9150/m.26138 type:complete len:302 (+) Transcript_9150:946-1851(+)